MDKAASIAAATSFRDAEPMNEVSKLELNAAIENLIESSGSDAVAREILASYATSIKSNSSAAMDISAQSSGGSLSGATPESGTVKIELDSKHEKEWKFGENSMRVGYYKISRKATRHLFRGVKEERIVVSHFWKADVATASETEEPESWCLSCDSKMQPQWFGKIASVELFHLGPLSVVLREVRETWGREVGSTHPHDVHIKARLNL